MCCVRSNNSVEAQQYTKMNSQRVSPEGETKKQQQRKWKYTGQQYTGTARVDDWKQLASWFAVLVVDVDRITDEHKSITDEHEKQQLISSDGKPPITSPSQREVFYGARSHCPKQREEKKEDDRRVKEQRRTSTVKDEGNNRKRFEKNQREREAGGGVHSQGRNTPTPYTISTPPVPPTARTPPERRSPSPSSLPFVTTSNLSGNTSTTSSTGFSFTDMIAWNIFLLSVSFIN